MPDALISMTTSRGPGVGSGKSRNSSFRSPRKTTPCMPTCSSQLPSLSQMPSLLLTHVPTAIGRDHLPGHVLCLLASEVDRRPGDVVGVAQALQRRLRGNAVAH